MLDLVPISLFSFLSITFHILMDIFSPGSTCHIFGSDRSISCRMPLPFHDGEQRRATAEHRRRRAPPPRRRAPPPHLPPLPPSTPPSICNRPSDLSIDFVCKHRYDLVGVLVILILYVSTLASPDCTCENHASKNTAYNNFTDINKTSSRIQHHKTASLRMWRKA